MTKTKSMKPLKPQTGAKHQQQPIHSQVTLQKPGPPGGAVHRGQEPRRYPQSDFLSLLACRQETERDVSAPPGQVNVHL